MSKSSSPDHTELPDPVIIHRKIDVINELQELGVDLETLKEAVLEGEEHRASCTENDPPGAGGVFSYARTTRRLLELLIPRGWRRKMDKNFPLAVSPDGNTAISVSTGDDGTGARYRAVKTKYPKGAATQAVLKDNRQLCLAFADDAVASEPPLLARCRTWFLLRRRWRHLLYWEISLPLFMEQDEPISRWARRIILPTIDLGPDADIGSQNDAEDDVIDVPIARR